MNNSFYYLGKLQQQLPDIEIIESSFENIQFESNCAFYNKDDKRLCWQYYDAGIYFSRNFCLYYQTLCNSLVKELQILQKKLLKKENHNELEKIFLQEKIHPNGFSLSKSRGNVSIHYDDTRDYCINIGLENCGNAITISSLTPNYEDFDLHTKFEYILQNQDIYIFNTKRYHKVTQIIPIEQFRYLITYSIR